MAQVAFPLTVFQDSMGNPVSFGYVLLGLSEDVQTPTPTQIASAKIAKINLDVNGTVIGSPQVWPSAELTPNDSVYVYNVYSQLGAEIVHNATLTV